VKYRAPGIFNEYRQESNFFYLTGGYNQSRARVVRGNHFDHGLGFNEPNALAVIGNDGSGDNHTFHLYVREKDARAELWDGARSGTQAAVDVFNADEVGSARRVVTGAIKQNGQKQGSHTWV
jgi:intermediate cleaving peptidase 55